jgi:uncharacterized circularly permuted ATP-grasp superfamily protein
MTVQEQRATLGYVPTAGYDEAFDGDGAVRPLYASLMADLEAVDLDELAREAGAYAADRGATFGGGRVFSVDPIPRLLDADEWAELEAGLGQRVRALDAFVADLARAEPRAVAAGAIPERLAADLPFREPDLVDVPDLAPARVAIAGLDVVRDANGRFRVLEDNVRTPSGMAYMLATRGASDACLPHDEPRRPLRATLANALSQVLADARPRPDDDAAVVVLSDGPSNDAFFEHHALADLAAVRLVTPADVRRDGSRLRLRDGGREIQVVYRRTDVDRLRDAAGALTPIGELLLEPLRAGTLVVLNAFGAGVADDKRIYPYVDALVRFYLDEEPLLPSVRTYDVADPAARAEVLDRLDELVVKPRDGHGGRGVTIGPTAGGDELAAAAAALRAEPERWTAQETVRLSTHPTVIDGRLEPRHVDLRPFVLFDGVEAHALPGGLTRVALRAGNLVVNSSSGGGGKDTWVLP